MSGPRVAGSAWERVLGAILLAGLLAVLGLYAVRAVRVATFPYDLDNGEAYVLDQARVLAGGTLPYTPITEEPYLVANYPPLYPLLLSLPVRLGSLSFSWGRWLSIAAALGTGLCLAGIVRRGGGGRLAAAAAGLLYFSSRFVHDWTPYQRVDSLGIFLVALGLWLAVSNRRAWQVGIPFALAILTRQTLVLAPLAVILWLLHRRCGREAVRLALVALGIPGAVGLILNGATGGEFWRHVVGYNVNPYSWDLVAAFVDTFLRHHPVLVGFGLFALFRRVARGPPDPLGTYALLTLAGFFLCGKVGASSNYMLEPVVALCLLSGRVLRDLGRDDGSGARTRQALALALLIGQVGIALAAGGRSAAAPVPDADYATRAHELARLVRAAPGDCLAEDNGYLLLNGKRVLYQPFIMSQLAAAGRWDPRPLVVDITRQRYSLIILTFDARREASIRFGPLVSRTIGEHYRVLRIVPGPGGGLRSPSPWWNYWVYHPR